MRLVTALRNQSLEAEPARLAEDLAAAARPVAGEPDRPGVGNDSAERFLAGLQGLARDVDAVQLEEIEDEVDELALPLPGERFLQGLEAGAAVREQDGDLAVDLRAARFQRLCRRDDLGKVAGPVVAAPAPQGHRPALDAAADPVAVVLDLVQPAVAFRRGFDERRQLGPIISRCAPRDPFRGTPHGPWESRSASQADRRAPLPSGPSGTSATRGSWPSGPGTPPVSARRRRGRLR